MIEKIKEAGQRLVSVVVEPVINVFRHRQRHRTVGAEKAEEIDRQVARTFGCRFGVRFDSRRLEPQRDLLAKPHHVLVRSFCVAHARQVKMGALQLPYGLEEVKVKRPLTQCLGQRIGRSPFLFFLYNN